MYIHESPGWPDFTWDKEIVEQKEREALLNLGYLAGRFSQIGFDNKLAAEVETMTNNVIATFEIEGMKLNTEGVRSSVARKFGYTLSNASPYSHYIEGIVDMMVDATDDYESPLSEQKFFNWHKKLFPENTDIKVGNWRDGEMSIVSGTLGRERVHYRAPEAKNVELEMKRFINWFNSTRPSVVKAAIAHLWFVCIHPFDDGNGRISRALSDRVMSGLSREKRQFYSLNRKILEKKSSYYKVLERVSRGEGDITEWLRWFLDTVEDAIIDSNTMLSQVLNKATFWRTHAESGISDRQRMVLNTYLDGYDAKITAKNWEKLANVSKDTALRDIASLVDKKILVPTPGKVRDVAYSIVINGEEHPTHFSNIKVSERKGVKFIEADLGEMHLVDKLLEVDVKRLADNEVSPLYLAEKYFAYALDTLD